MLGVGLWIAASLGAEIQRRIVQAEKAENLAHSVDLQFDLAKTAVLILAQKPALRDCFHANPGRNPENLRHCLVDYLNDSMHDFNKWFNAKGGPPLVNVFILDHNGKIIADTYHDSYSVGMNFRNRIYFSKLVSHKDPEAVCVSCVIRSRRISSTNT